MREDLTKLHTSTLVLRIARAARGQIGDECDPIFDELDRRIPIPRPDEPIVVGRKGPLAALPNRTQLHGIAGSLGDVALEMAPTPSGKFVRIGILCVRDCVVTTETSMPLEFHEARAAFRRGLALLDELEKREGRAGRCPSPARPQAPRRTPRPPRP